MWLLASKISRKNDTDDCSSLKNKKIITSNLSPCLQAWALLFLFTFTLSNMYDNLQLLSNQFVNNVDFQSLKISRISKVDFLSSYFIILDDWNRAKPLSRI